MESHSSLSGLKIDPILTRNGSFVLFLGLLNRPESWGQFCQMGLKLRQVKILVKRDRADPVVNPDPNTQLAMASLTEEDLNSEVELLKSRRFVILQGPPGTGR